MEADDGAAGDLFITLVHGTWPRGVWRDVFFTPFYGKWPISPLPKWLWFADGSEFRNRLTEALSKRGLSVQMSPFLWSGENSVRERDKAARELGEHIRTKQSEYPSSTQVVIAHSHGGNVAFRAVDQTGVASENIFIATIATPFVEILQAKLSSKESWRLLFSVGLVAAIPLNLLFKFIEKTSGIPGYISSFILAALGILLYRTTRIKVDELVQLTSLSPSVRKHPLLILRAVDDEAALSLAAAAIGNRLSALIGLWSYRILVATMILILPILIFSLLFVTGEFFGWKFLVDFGNKVDEYFDWAMVSTKGGLISVPLWAMYVGGFSGFIALFLAPGVCKSFFGRELLFNFQTCNINSQTTPDSIDRQSEFHLGSEWGVVVTLANESRRGLRHGLYNDPQCVERIAAWLAATDTR